MKRSFVAVLVLVAATEAFAFRQVGFGMSAFDCVHSSQKKNTVVFSPLSFELDCAVFAACYDTLQRAHVAETIGVLTDLAGTYGPILETYSQRTNGLSCVMARGFGVPDVFRTNPALVQEIQRDYSVEVGAIFPKKGIENWFRAAMDGEMEDFSISVETARAEHYSFFDLISVQAAFAEPFPLVNSRKLTFTSNGAAEELEFMADVRVADTWQAKDFMLLRLPLRGDAFFYALLPNEGADLRNIRGDLSSSELSHLLSVLDSTTEKGVVRGPTAIVLPRIHLASTVDFAPAFLAFRFPTKGLTGIADEIGPRELRQSVALCLTEHAENEPPLQDKPVERQVKLGPSGRKLVFNRPFAFFIYHQPTATIPVVGQFYGAGAPSASKRN